MCIAGTCLAAGEITPDAPSVADAPGDRDGDGVLDPDDNCPDTPNPDQGNEDGDRFGDACDPCPIDANDNPVDDDMDGVADPCDPNPSMPGDAIVLFEGFHAGLPATWTASRVTTAQSGDDLTITSQARGYVAAPIAAPTNGYVGIGVTIDSSIGSGASNIGVAMPYDGMRDDGVVCELAQGNVADPTSTDLSLFDHVSGVELASGVFPWTTDAFYGVGLGHAGTTYNCAAADATATTTATGNSTDAPGSLVVIRTFAITANVSWLLVVSSPP
jgi:hypothetical protein